ncbi:MAG: CotH kinase family protein, partial [Planctomycetota bacterium]
FPGPGGGFPGGGGGFPGGGGGFPGGGGGFPGGGFPGGPGAFPAGPPTQMLAGHLLRQADKDQDGKLSAVELTTFWDQLLRAHDQDRDAKLDEAEMAMLLEKILPAPGLGAGVGGGPPGGFPRGGNREPAKPGEKLSPADVKQFQDEPWFDHQVLRTLFFTFAEDDWEAELAEFHNTDVDVAATLQVDGREYPLVGVSFRGMSSYGMVPAGYKRSFNVVIDLVDGEQRVQGQRTLNLLNAHEDPSFLSSVLYSHVARQYLPAPRANFVRVVVNGENWGIYVNVEQFNKDFLKENYHTTKGDRWKVRGSPAGGGGLEYLGDNLDDYQRRYQLKSADKPEAWQALIKLCRTLNQTPAEELERALEPLLDLDGALRFLALDVALINNDGYWVRASDYSLYRDAKGKFHLLPHDMNEAFHGQMGGPGMGPPGMRGGRAPGDAPAMNQPARPSPVALDPLVALDDPRKPLRSRLLAVPALRERYLRYVRQIAQEQLDWKQLGPIVTHFRQLLEPELARDTRKLSSVEAFLRATADEPADGSLRGFIEKRREFLLSHPALGALDGNTKEPRASEPRASEPRASEPRVPGKPAP